MSERFGDVSDDDEDWETWEEPPALPITAYDLAGVLLDGAAGIVHAVGQTLHGLSRMCLGAAALHNEKAEAAEERRLAAESMNLIDKRSD